MTEFAFALGLFLLAFSGLAVGLIFKRRGLRGSCGSAQKDHDCRCETELDASMQQQSNCHGKEKPACAAEKHISA